MAEWNRIPFDFERPDTELLDRDEIEVNIIDFMYGILARYGRIETGVQLRGGDYGYTVIETPPVELSKGKLFIGQVPFVAGKAIMERGVYSFAAPSTARDPLMALAIFDSVTDAEAPRVVDHQGALPKLEDLHEVQDALHMLWYSPVHTWADAKPEIDPTRYPHRSSKRHDNRYCLTHQVVTDNEWNFRPDEFDDPE